VTVGDVNSSARGSGARYNDGKPEMELLPISDLARYRHHSLGKGASQAQVRAADALLMLGTWQETGDARPLYKALERMDDDGQLAVDCARVFTYGKAKYAAWNWAKGMAWSIPLACAVRHLEAIIAGEQLDPVDKRAAGCRIAGTSPATSSCCSRSCVPTRRATTVPGHSNRRD
jgi:hypothetical protein